MKKILFVLSVCSVFFVGCTFHSGILTPANVIIQENNFQKVKTIYGSASATYFFGIGGNEKEGLVNEAKQNLYSKYNLLPNQTITNITYDISHQIILGIYYKQTCYISADIIQFSVDGNTSSDGSIQTQTNTKPIDGNTSSDGSIQTQTTKKPITVNLSEFSNNIPSRLRRGSKVIFNLNGKQYYGEVGESADATFDSQVRLSEIYSKSENNDKWIFEKQNKLIPINFLSHYKSD